MTAVLILVALSVATTAAIVAWFWRQDRSQHPLTPDGGLCHD